MFHTSQRGVLKKVEMRPGFLDPRAGAVSDDPGKHPDHYDKADRIDEPNTFNMGQSFPLKSLALPTFS